MATIPRVVIATTSQLDADTATESTNASGNTTGCVIAAAVFAARSEFEAIENMISLFRDDTQHLV